MFESHVQFRKSVLNRTTQATEDPMLSRVDGIAIVEEAFEGEALDWVSTQWDLCFAYLQGQVVATVHTTRVGA